MPWDRSLCLPCSDPYRDLCAWTGVCVRACVCVFAHLDTQMSLVLRLWLCSQHFLVCVCRL